MPEQDEQSWRDFDRQVIFENSLAVLVILDLITCLNAKWYQIRPLMSKVHQN